MPKATNAQVVTGLKIIAKSASKGDREDRRFARFLEAEAERREAQNGDR